MKNIRKSGAVIVSLLCLILCLALVPAVNAGDTAIVAPAHGYQADSLPARA